MINEKLYPVGNIIAYNCFKKFYIGARRELEFLPSKDPVLTPHG